MRDRRQVKIVEHLIPEIFKASHGLITVSTQHTLIVQNPKNQLIGFAKLMNEFWDIERADDRKRPLIWVLDYGQHTYAEKSRMKYLNVRDLLTRLDALKRFEDHHSRERWEWMKLLAVIILCRYEA